MIDLSFNGHLRIILLVGTPAKDPCTVVMAVIMAKGQVRLVLVGFLQNFHSMLILTTSFLASVTGDAEGRQNLLRLIVGKATWRESYDAIIHLIDVALNVPRVEIYYEWRLQIAVKGSKRARTSEPSKKNLRTS